MVKVELEFESKNSDVSVVFQDLSEVLSKAQEKGFNLKEVEIESDEKQEGHC